MDTLLLKNLFEGAVAREEIVGNQALRQAFESDAAALGQTAGRAFGGAKVQEAQWALLDFFELVAEAWGGPYSAGRDRLGTMIGAMPPALQAEARKLGMERDGKMDKLVAQFSTAVKARLLASDRDAGPYALKDAFMKLATSRDEKKELVERFTSILKREGKFDAAAQEVAEMVTLAPLLKAYATRLTRKPNRCAKFLVVGMTCPRTDQLGSIVAREGHEVAYGMIENAETRLREERPNIVVLAVDDGTVAWDRLAQAVRRRQPVTPFIAVVPEPAMAHRPSFADSPTSKCLMRPVQIREFQLAVRYFASLS